MNLLIIITSQADTPAGRYAIETLVAGCLLEYNIRLIIATEIDLDSKDDLALANIMASPQMFNLNDIKTLAAEYIPAFKPPSTALSINVISAQLMNDWLVWSDYTVIK